MRDFLFGKKVKHSEQVAAMLESLPKDVQKKLAGLEDSVILKLNKLPAQMLQQALQNDALFDKLIAIAKMEKAPEMPGFFGMVGRSIWPAGKNALVAATVITGGSLLSDQMKWNVPMLNTVHNKDAIAQERAQLVKDGMPEDKVDAHLAQKYPPQDPVGAYAKKFGLIAAVSGGIGMVMNMVMGLSGDQIKQEIDMEQRIWQMMNAGEGPAASGPMASREDTDIEIPRLPHAKGGLGRGNNAGLHA